ncbi:MAG: QueG-associated DUF1730 domain-containing protein, partial [Planctomycetota bacterium]
MADVYQPTIDPASMRFLLRQTAFDLGFHLFGITPAVSLTGYSHLIDWIEAGNAGTMDYIDKRRDAYQHPRGVLPGVRSVIALGFPYRTTRPIDPRPGQARIARYAWGDVDYHDHLHPRLKQLCRTLDAADPDSRSRGVVDTAPLLEREIAAAAGLGWVGKNTLLLNREHGSYFFLACVLTTWDLPADEPVTDEFCGSCTACLDACPTDAFVKPGVM